MARLKPACDVLSNTPINEPIHSESCTMVAAGMFNCDWAQLQNLYVCPSNLGHIFLMTT